MKEETVGEKKAHELGQLPTSLAAFTDQFRKEKAYLHLKLNLAKSYKQEEERNVEFMHYSKERGGRISREDHLIFIVWSTSFQHICDFILLYVNYIHTFIAMQIVCMFPLLNVNASMCAGFNILLCCFIM